MIFLQFIHGGEPYFFYFQKNMFLTINEIRKEEISMRLQYEFDEASKECSLVKVIGEEKYLYIPDMVGDFKITSLASHSFDDSEIEAIRLPRYLKVIKEEAFPTTIPLNVCFVDDCRQINNLAVEKGNEAVLVSGITLMCDESFFIEEIDKAFKEKRNIILLGDSDCLYKVINHARSMLGEYLYGKKLGYETFNCGDFSFIENPIEKKEEMEEYYVYEGNKDYCILDFVNEKVDEDELEKIKELAKEYEKNGKMVIFLIDAEAKNLINRFKDIAEVLDYSYLVRFGNGSSSHPKEKNKLEKYLESINKSSLYPEIIEWYKKEEKPSISKIQRVFGMGYPTAAKIFNILIENKSN